MTCFSDIFVLCHCEEYNKYELLTLSYEKTKTRKNYAR
jgi:hypothetical protein